MALKTTVATKQAHRWAFQLYSRHLVNMFSNGTKNSIVSPGTAVMSL